MRRHGRIATLAGLGPSDHLCWAYEDGAALRSAAVAFLADGARLGLRLVYSADRPRAALRRDLAALPDVDGLVARGALVLTPLAELYGTGSVDPAALRALAERTLAEALDAGYAGLRVVADGTPLARGRDGREALAHWEQLADDLTASAPLSALCAYDRSALGPGAVDEVLCLHPLTHVASEQPPFRLFGHGRDLVLAGEVDLFAAPRLDRVLASARARCAGALDLSRLRFIDHHGLVALARHGSALSRDGGPLTIRGASPALRRAWALALDGDAPPVAWA